MSLSEQPSKTNFDPLAALSDATRGIIGAVIDYHRFPQGTTALTASLPMLSSEGRKGGRIANGECISNNEYLTRSDSTKEVSHFLLLQRET